MGFFFFTNITSFFEGLLHFGCGKPARTFKPICFEYQSCITWSFFSQHELFFSCPGGLMASGDTFVELICTKWTGVASVSGYKSCYIWLGRWLGEAGALPGVNQGTKWPPVCAERRGNSPPADWRLRSGPRLPDCSPGERRLEHGNGVVPVITAGAANGPVSARWQPGDH